MSRHVAVVLLLLAACTKTTTEVVTIPAPDTTAPIVLLTSPETGAGGVPLNARASAAFSEAMDAGTLASSFSLTGLSGVVAGTAAASPDARTVTFTPAAALDPDTEYTATISTAALDAAGNALTSPVSWTFRTAAAADPTPPSVVAVSPATGSLAAAASTPTVTATFDEPIDCAALPSAAIALYEQDLPVPATVACSGATLELVPLSGLPTQTSLLAVVSPLVRDLAGNPLGAAQVWSFDVRPWTVQFGSAVDDYGMSVATDGAGNVFVAGFTAGDMEGGGSAGFYEVFVVKYRASGSREWTRQLGCAGADVRGAAVATDGEGSVYVAGVTKCDLDGNVYAGGYDLFLAKYDSAGTKQWTRQLGSAADEGAGAVATDGEGNVYVAGYTMGDLDGNVAAGAGDVYLVKYDAAGTKGWTRQLGSAAGDTASGVATDVAGNVYVTGFTMGGLDGNVNAGGYDILLAKYDSSGARKWTRQLGTALEDVGRGVATDSAGNVFVAGGTYGNLDGNTSAGSYDVIVTKYLPTGARQWTRQLGSAGFEFASSLAVDGAGNLYAAGVTDGALDGTLSGGLGDLFVVKYDGAGAKQWTRQLASAGSESTYGVATDAAGDVFVSGYTFGDLDGNVSLGSYDLFVVKYGADGRKR